MRRDKKAGGFGHAHSATHNPFTNLQEEEEETYGCMVSTEESLDTLAKATESNVIIIKETPTITKKISEIGDKIDKVITIFENGN